MTGEIYVGSSSWSRAVDAGPWEHWFVARLMLPAAMPVRSGRHGLTASSWKELYACFYYPTFSEELK